jgi:hypothetical protein
MYFFNRIGRAAICHDGLEHANNYSAHVRSLRHRQAAHVVNLETASRWATASLVQHPFLFVCISERIKKDRFRRTRLYWRVQAARCRCDDVTNSRRLTCSLPALPARTPRAATMVFPKPSPNSSLPCMQPRWGRKRSQQRAQTIKARVEKIW